MNMTTKVMTKCRVSLIRLENGDATEAVARCLEEDLGISEVSAKRLTVFLKGINEDITRFVTEEVHPKHDCRDYLRILAGTCFTTECGKCGREYVMKEVQHD